MTITILPGSHADSQAFEPPSGGRGPRPNRTLVAVIAVAVVLAGGAGWWLLRGSSGSSSATTPVVAPVHHVASHGFPVSGPVSHAQARALGNAVFSVLPSALAGYHAVDKVHVYTSPSTPKEARQVARCLGHRAVTSTNVDSMVFTQGAHFLQGQVVIDPSASAARRDFADGSSGRGVRCGLDLNGGRMRLDRGLYATDVKVRMSHPKGLKGSLLVQLTGVADGTGVTGVPVRVDVVAVVVGRVIVTVQSFGMGEAVPASGDIAVLRQLVAKAKTQL